MVQCQSCPPTTSLINNFVSLGGNFAWIWAEPRKNWRPEIRFHDCCHSHRKSRTTRWMLHAKHELSLEGPHQYQRFVEHHGTTAPVYEVCVSKQDVLVHVTKNHRWIATVSMYIHRPLPQSLYIMLSNSIWPEDAIERTCFFNHHVKMF